MSELKFRSAPPLAAIIVGIVFLMGFDCPPKKNGNTSTGDTGGTGDAGGFVIVYNNSYNPTADDVGGAKTPADVPITWAGARQLASNEGQTAGDTFKDDTTWHGIATDAWTTNHLVPNRKPGNWNLSVTVNGRELQCQSTIALAAGAQVNVTFEVDKSDVFAGCTVTSI